MQTIGIIGLGTMGLGLAQVYASAGFPVIATDAQPQARETAKTRLDATLSARVAAGKLDPDARDACLANLTITENLADFSQCALIVEAIVEKLEAKQSLMRDLQAIAPGAILATNTSSIPVHQIAAALNHPEALLALHFFNPPAAMKLVELAPHEGTSPKACDLARSITEAAGKTVIQCKDRPGFIVNRCARPFYGEALALLEEGRDARDIDGAMLAAGYRIGPLSLIDLIGADINLAATEGLYAALDQHPRYFPFQVLRAQVAAGHLGRKSGQGFVFPAEIAPKPDTQLALRIEATLVNEAASLLAEGSATTEGIDVAMRLGLNFPRGPFQALKLHGKDAILATLRGLQAKAPPHLAARYQPVAALVSL